MGNLSKSEIIKRLGMAPDLWEFRGQCYDCGTGNSRVCALTQQGTRFCFTLKPKVGKGKANIGPASFFLLKRHAPDLYMQLERGRHWLQLMVEAEKASIRSTSFRRRVTETRDRFTAVRQIARKRVGAYRAVCPHGELPAQLMLIRTLLDRKIPAFQNDETARLWFEQAILELEHELLVTHSYAEKSAPAPAPVRSFKPVPEISF
jgi:hypothetical protein